MRQQNGGEKLFMVNPIRVVVVLVICILLAFTKENDWQTDWSEYSE